MMASRCRFFSCQQSCGHSTGGCGTDGSDLSCIKEHKWLAMLCIKQHYYSLVRRKTRFPVGMKNTDHFNTHYTKFCCMTRHHTQQTGAIRKPHNIERKGCNILRRQVNETFFPSPQCILPSATTKRSFLYLQTKAPSVLNYSEVKVYKGRAFEVDGCLRK